MISTSKDVFYIVLSAAIILFTIFSCWFFYYFISIIREVRRGVKEVHGAIKHVDEAIHGVKEKFERSISVFAVMGEAVKQLVGYFVAKKGGRTGKKKR